MKSCICYFNILFDPCQKLRLKNIIFLNHHFCVNNRNRIRRIATESELLQNGGGKKKELGFCRYIMATIRQPTMTYFRLRFRLAENYVIPSLLYKLLLF